jgi:hypothetical protein
VKGLKATNRRIKMYKKSDKVEHKTFGSGKVVEEMGKGAHGDRVLIKFDTGEQKGVERVILTNHLENHSENDRIIKEREKDEIAKIKRRKMVIDSSQLDGLEEDETEQVVGAQTKAGGEAPDAKPAAKADEKTKGEPGSAATSKTAKKKKKKKNKKKKK